MNLETKIKMAMTFKGMTQQIAKALGAKYQCYFEFEDGTKI